MALFGYMSASSNIFNDDNELRLKDVNPFLPSYISLSMNITPEFDIPSANDMDFASGFENPQFLIMGRRWLNNFYKSEEKKDFNVQIWA